MKIPPILLLPFFLGVNYALAETSVDRLGYMFTFSGNASYFPNSALPTDPPDEGGIVNPATPSDETHGATEIAGFLIPKAELDSVLRTAHWLNRSIAPAHFPDPFREALKALSLVILNGTLTGEQIEKELSQLPDGKKAKLALNWDPMLRYSPEIAYANATRRYNELVLRSADTNRKLFEDPGLKAIRNLLITMNKRFLLGEGK
jgi:hypothetical protein